MLQRLWCLWFPVTARSSALIQPRRCLHSTNFSFPFSFSSSDSVRNKGGRVFVHCQAGISRSATICLAYLMRTNRVKLDEAFEFVKQRRSIISPNFSFMGQLLQFESQVLASSTCSSEAGSPAIGGSSTVFNFPVSIPVHTSAGQLSFLHSPITTSPSCWRRGLAAETLFGLERQLERDFTKLRFWLLSIYGDAGIALQNGHLLFSGSDHLAMWSAGQISVAWLFIISKGLLRTTIWVLMFNLRNVKINHTF